MHIMTFVEASSDKAAQDNCCLQCAGQKKKTSLQTFGYNKIETHEPVLYTS